MTLHLLRPLCAILVLAAAAWLPSAVQAQAGAFPSKQILFVVTSPPGGSNDTFARAIGKKLSDALGKPVVVENRPGATGSIGEGFVAKSAPDGHTIVMISSTYTTKSAIATNLPFDPLTAFTPVAMVGKGPLLLAVAPATPFKTTEELFAYAKANPGKLNYATSGTGSINHFATELMGDAAGIKLTHVPYKGMGPATADLMAGHVQVLIASAPSMLAQVKGGKVRGLGVTTVKPSAIAPGLAPVAAAGAPAYNVELWWGILAPAGTPKDVIAKLNTEINKALATDEMKEFLAREGAEAAPVSPEAFGEVIRADIARWKKVAATAGIKAD